MASAESQTRFGQSVKGLLSDKVGSCSGDVIALTRQVLKGSRSQEVSNARVALLRADPLEKRAENEPWLARKNTRPPRYVNNLRYPARADPVQMGMAH
uniref:BLOC-1-related complex subunit 7 n=1 Tax=Nothobranchius furzeri TaxID=105023 RepID=A0A8C6KDF0_NOTFU